MKLVQVENTAASRSNR